MIIFLYLYIITVSWTSAFAIGLFNLPLLFSGCYLLTSFIKSNLKINYKVIKYVIIPFVFSSFYYLISSIINSHSKSINYTFVYILVPLLFCYLPMSIIIHKKNIKNIETYFINSLIFIGLLCIFESIIRFYFKYDITSLVPQLKDNLVFTITSANKVLNRSRGFSSEPLIVGLSLSLGLQYSFIKLKNTFLTVNTKKINNLFKYLLYTVLFIFAILSTGSASSFVISTLGVTFLLVELMFIFLYDLYKRKINIPILQIFCLILLSLSSLIIILNIIPAYQVALENILSKISLNREFSSVRERLDIFDTYLNYFLSDPIGITGSVGSYSKEFSAINWYLTVLGDIGILGVFFTFIPLISSILISINSPIHNGFSRYDKYLLISIPLFGLCFHGTFYSSPLWAIILISYYL